MNLCLGRGSLLRWRYFFQKIEVITQGGDDFNDGPISGRANEGYLFVSLVS